MTSLRSRLIRTAALQALLLGGALIVIAQIRVQQTDDALSQQIIEQAKDHVETRLHGFFDPIANLLETASAWSEDGMIDLDQPEQLNAMLMPIMRRYPRISSVSVADDLGREQMVLHRDTTWRVRRTRRVETNAELEWWIWSDDAPEVEKTRDANDYDPRERPWFKTALTAAESEGWKGGSGPVSWSTPYEFWTTAEWGLSASIARRRGDRTIVIAFDVLLEDVTQFTMRELDVTPNARVFVMTDHVFQVIGLPRDVRFEDPGERMRAIRKRAAEFDIAPIDAMVTALAKHAQGGESVMGRAFAYDSGSDRWWGGIRRFSLSEGRDLIIGVTLPDTDLRGDLTQVRIWIAVITALLFALALWFANRNAKLVSEPIEDLAQGSRRIEQGDLDPGDHRVSSGIEEIQVLAMAQERIERNLDVAREIQEGALPDRLPELPGYDLAAHSRPAEATGGDTYDAIGVSDTGMTPLGVKPEMALLLLADATGHGVGPALAVMQLRAMMRMAIRVWADFGDVIPHVNEQLHHDLPSSRFITAWFGLLDARSHTLRTFSAGQAPMLLFDASEDAFTHHYADIYPLGMMETMEVEPKPAIVLDPEDVYVVLSDGYYEAPSPTGEEFGLARVEAVVRAARGGTAADLLEALDAAVEAFTEDALPDDDRTAVVIRRAPA